MKGIYLVVLGSLAVLMILAGCTQTNNSATGLAGLQLNPVECIDSDAGKDVFTTGYVKGVCADCGQAGTIGGNSDACITETNGATSVAESSDKVMEFYCTADGWKREAITCLSGCSQGACLK